MIRKIIALAAAPIAALAITGTAQAAIPHAPADNCLTGTYAGYCGHQTDTRGLTLTVGANLKVTNQLFLVPNTQMVWENPPGVTVTNNAKIALWFGQLPGFKLAMTQAGSNVIMATYVPGDLAQQWAAVPVNGGFAWQNQATGDYIEGHGYMQAPVTTTPSLAAADAYTFIEG